jgi:hypothetical protein
MTPYQYSGGLILTAAILVLMFWLTGGLRP